MNNYDRMHQGEDKVKIPVNRAKQVVDEKRKRVVKIVFAIVLVISCLFLIGLFDLYGAAYSNAIYGAFGCSAIAFGIILIVVSLLKLIGLKPRKLSARTICYMVVLCLLLVLFLQIISTVKDFKALDDKSYKSYLDSCFLNGRNNAGGALFGIISYPFLNVLGSVTSLCVIAILFFGTLLLCFRSFFYVEKVQTIVSEESENSGMYIETVDDKKRKNKTEEKIDLMFPNNVSPDDEPEEEVEEAEIEYTASTLSDRLARDVFNDELDKETRAKRAEELLFMSEEELKKTIKGNRDETNKKNVQQETPNSAIRTGEREPYQKGFGGTDSEHRKMSVEEAYKNYAAGGLTAEELLFGGIIDVPDLSYDELYPKQNANDLYFDNGTKNQNTVIPSGNVIPTGNVIPSAVEESHPYRNNVVPNQTNNVIPTGNVIPSGVEESHPYNQPTNKYSLDNKQLNNQFIENKTTNSVINPSTPLPELTDINTAIYDESLDLDEIKTPYVEQKMIKPDEEIEPRENPFKTVYRELTDDEREELSGKKEELIKSESKPKNTLGVALKPSETTTPASTPASTPAPVKKVIRPYTCPSLALLSEPEPTQSNIDYVSVYKQIEDAFASYDISCKVIAHTRGPTFTLYAVQLGQGVYFKRVMSREEDINRKLCCDEPIHIVPTVKDMDAIGIEVFYRNLKTKVPLKRYLFSEKYKEPDKLYIPIGVDVYGDAYYCNVLGAPHILIGGTTGSGKSVCLNAILCTILYNYSPEFVKLILVDPKAVELAPFATVPHNLLGQSINDEPTCIKALSWAVDEMNRRYKLMESVQMKQLSNYNKHLTSIGEKPLPYIVIVIDELADFMLNNKKTAAEIEVRINILTAKARASGIHLILATQRPSSEIVTGLIKNNVSTRIAFTMGDAVASKVILDRGGAEKLYGKGDLLFTSSDYSRPLRLQGMFIDDPEVIAVTDYVKEHNDFEPDEKAYEEIFNPKPVQLENMMEGNEPKMTAAQEREKDFNELYNDALVYAVQHGEISTSKVQKLYRIGYLKASTITDKMFEDGVIEAAVSGSSKSRKVLISEDQLEDYMINYDGDHED